MFKENKTSSFDKFWETDLADLESSLIVVDSCNNIELPIGNFNYLGSVDGVPTNQIHGRTLQELGYQPASRGLKRYWNALTDYILSKF